MEQIELDFNEALEGLINLADYLLALSGKRNVPFCEDMDPLEDSDQNVISEIEIELDSIAHSLINNLLKAKGILSYTEDCDYETIQNLYEEIIDYGSKGYFELLKKFKEEHMKFGIINAVVQPSKK